MELTITFPGGLKVDAQYGDQVVKTDQSVRAGGEGSAPEPFMHMLGSIGTCAGIYVLGFCKARHLPTDGIQLKQRLVYDEVKRKIGRVEIDIEVPKDFPEKYYEALVRSADQCAVKKFILDPPEFAIQTVAV